MNPSRLPPWLRRSIAMPAANPTREILARYQLTTVCESAVCPNQNECYSHGTATFMILGDRCTRRCSFCAVGTAKPFAPEADEPERIARGVVELGLEYVVITSVARDDLPDEGAGHFAETVAAVRNASPQVRVEVLTPDFHARPELVRRVADSGPVVFNHNVETVARLQRGVRPQADYRRSIRVLEIAKDCWPGMKTKSGLMLGLGETVQEILQTGRDLRSAGCDLLTLGQYLPPGRDFPPAAEFISPGQFSDLAKELRTVGFEEVFAGPHVRSSYHAGQAFAAVAGR